MRNYQEYVDPSFDESFAALIRQKNLSWSPWVGKDYKRNASRILFVLESAYRNESNRGTIGMHDFTRQTIYEVFVKGEQYSTSLNNLRDLLKELFGEIANGELGWQKLAYHNVVQRPLCNAKDRPTPADYNSGCFLLKEVLQILKPTLCVCMGVGLNTPLREGEAFRGRVARIKTEPGKIDGVWLRDRIDIDSNGFTSKMIFAAHPENKTGFTAKAWAEYLKRQVPNEIRTWKESVL